MSSPTSELAPEEQLLLIIHRLRKTRESKGISQQKLAEKIETHVNTVAAYEKNCRPPTLLLLLRACRVLKVTLAELLDETLPALP